MTEWTTYQSKNRFESRSRSLKFLLLPETKVKFNGIGRLKIKGKKKKTIYYAKINKGKTVQGILISNKVDVRAKKMTSSKERYRMMIKELVMNVHMKQQSCKRRAETGKLRRVNKRINGSLTMVEYFRRPLQATD